ncbi:MAG: AAA family ATPase [Proteobacteria bacterium]|nr:AAA family ATPase [Burkholderiales bacterium]
MYLGHFGLREMPFGITPDTSFAYACSAHQEAINTLMVAVANGEGFMKITGEVGTGKTLLCRRFLSMLGPRCVTAYIPNPYLEPRALLLALADELSIALEREGDQPWDQHRLVKGLTGALLEHAANGRQVVVCLDEAQAMPAESLEALRLLTNLETEKRKLLQVVLFGQPELDERLAHPTVRQLRQRITFEYRLEALDRRELDFYLAHRLRVAGYRSQRLFAEAAVRRLHRVTRGVPRLANIVAHKSLLLAFGAGVHRIEAAHVSAAAVDTPAVARRARWWWLPARV